MWGMYTKITIAMLIFLSAALTDCGNLYNNALEPLHEAGGLSQSKRELDLRRVVNPLWWFFNANCHVRCHPWTPKNFCSSPPTLQEYCASILNLAWCCQQWLYKQPLWKFFLPDCQVACVTYVILCPYSRCKLCEEKNFNHPCCDDCRKPKPPPTPEPPTPEPPTTTEMPTTTQEPMTPDTEPPTTTVETPIAPPPAALCPDVPDIVCRRNDGNPVDCLLSTGCAYSCATRTCHLRLDIEGDCYSGCSNYCGQKCGCILTPGCTFNRNGICQPTFERYCRLSSFPKTECARKYGFYATSGVICQNLVPKGNCQLDTTILAVNLGSDNTVTDSLGIEYQPQSSVIMHDPLQIGRHSSFKVEDIITDRAKDAELFSTTLTTEAVICTTEALVCIDFIIPKDKLTNGVHELGIRTIEGVYDQMRMRHFSVYFADIPIISELDIFYYSNKTFQPMDVFVNFHVQLFYNLTRIYLNGLYIHVEPYKNFTLSFCRGECGLDTSFMVSAFHIIKQKPYEAEVYDPCEEKTIAACDEGKFGVSECRRQDSIYSIDGQLCKMESSGGNCDLGEVVKAINFNGLPVVDSRGISYAADSRTGYFESVPGILLLKDAIKPISGISEDEQSLYGNIIYGDENAGGLRPCISGRFPLCGDGKYELAIRLADDESNAPRDRLFNIHLEDIPVFLEVDVFVFAGNQNSTAVDLLLNFEVTNGISKLIIKNEPYDTELQIRDEKDIEIAFCFSNCSTAMHKNFIAGGISLVKFAESQVDSNSSCEVHGSDVCACKYDGNCEFDVVKDQCVPRNRVCGIKCGMRETRECRRGGEHYYYAIGGTICQSDTETGSCDDKETLLAINFGGTTHTDIHGVTYVTDKLVPYDDPDSVREDVNYMGMNNMAGVPVDDIPLYNQHIYGNSARGSSCLTYNLPTAGDGFYELSIKSGEAWYTELRIRDFSLKLNEQYIVREFEPARYRFPPDAFDLNVNFKVYDISSKIELEGHSPSDITSTDLTIPLSLCFGTCEWENIDHNWIIGAFSLIKFDQKLPCTTYKDNKCGCQYAEHCTFTAGGSCVDHKSACGLSNNKANECRRGGDHVFYAEGGIICQNQVVSGDSGKCEIEKVLIAVNLNGVGHKDINGIIFIKGSDIDYADPQGTIIPGSTSVKGVPDSDVALYNTYLMGDKKVANDSCVTFVIPTDGDGRYELSLKTGEVTYPGRREFNILLNGEYIAEHFEPAQIRQQPDAFDLNVFFKISGGGTTLELPGYPSSAIDSPDKTIPLEFCFGNCGWPHGEIGWISSGFSVVKFNDGPLCSSFKNDPCACRSAGHCEFNVNSGDCSSRIDVCSSSLILPSDPQECRRAGEHVYYAVSGIVCVNFVEIGECGIEKTVLAVNFNGNPLMDSNDVPFQDDTNFALANSYVGETPTNARQGVPAKDEDLHGTYIHGDISQSTECFTFPIPVSGDGYYEISIKTGETEYDTITKRSYSILLFDQYIVKEFEPAQIRQTPYGFDLNVNYKITYKETKFMMTGHPEIDLPADKIIPLQFCFGECGGEMDPNWHAGAIAVNKLEGKLPCSHYNGDPCACRYHGICEYNVNNDNCVERKTACNRTFTGDECRRFGEHILQVEAGMICRNAAPYGNCERVSTTPVAINFGEEAVELTDSYKVSYLLEDTIVTDDPNGVIVKSKTDKSILGVPSKDVELYATFAYGDKNINSKGCVTYYVELTDGYYELSLKFAEVEYAEIQKRAFSVRFNEEYIIREFEPARYRFTPLGMNLNINFRVYDDDGRMLIMGHDPSSIQNNDEVPLEFCFGTCDWPGVDINWFINAVSISKFRKSCSTQSDKDDPCKCHGYSSKCLQDVVSGQCIQKDSACYHFPSLPNECRRGGNHTFYVDAGIACKVHKSSGKCKMQETLLAINFGQGAEPLTDSHGITFQPDENIPFDDPDGVKANAVTNDDILGIPSTDQNLFNTYIYSTEIEKACVKYYVPTAGDGEYELHIRTGEFSEKTKLRDYGYKFNGEYLVRTFDPARHEHASHAINLIANFQITKNGTKVQMRGHPSSKIMGINGTIPLEFCSGKCKRKSTDNTWFISAFSVVKFET